AADLYAFTGPGDAEPNLFMVYATPQGDTTLEQLETEMRKEVARLREEPLAADALERAKKRRRAAVIRTLETNMGLARALAESAQISGDPYYLERRLRELESLTPEDLRAFAAEYLINDNLTVSVLL